ncbi:MAG: transketolase C-terminal domain-containing protein [Sterolibacterium sp.]|jgi:transketolase
MTVDIRDAFFDRVYEFAAKDKNVVFLSADADAFSLQKFKRDFPDRYINVGVAEQNMVTVATGLALAGKNVFIYAILPFVTMRCYEQIKFNICGMNLPVTIVGVGVGYSFEFDGPSHHGVSDVGIMRMLPEMTLCNPATPLCAASYAQQAYESSTPVCVRLDKGPLRELYSVGDTFSRGMNLVRGGTDLCIVATGREVQRSFELAEILEGKGVTVGILDVHRLKPIDSSAFLSEIAPYERIVTLEENSIIGGLGSAVAEILVDNGVFKPLKRCALPDVQCLKYGKREWLQRQYGFDTETLVTSMEEWMGLSGGTDAK